MRSRTIVSTSAGLSSSELGAVARSFGRDPDLALAFLPASVDLGREVETLADAWPGAVRLGCEAAGQIADGRSVAEGVVHAFWFDGAGRSEVIALEGSFDRPPGDEGTAALAERLGAAGGGLFLVDGLDFPAERVLTEVGRRLASTACAIAGGLASATAADPCRRDRGCGARVFLDREIRASTSLALLLTGVETQVEVLRGFMPASPIYTVTRAEGNVVYEIEGEPATDWYRRFFTVRGELAPLPEAAQGFPLIVVGPTHRRQDLYRSLREFDRPAGAVTFWGGLETGDQVRMGMFGGLENDLAPEPTEGADRRVGGAPPEAAILFSCVDRAGALKERAEEEVAAIQRTLGDAPLSGFLSLGEIGPSGEAAPAFYNHTAVLVLLREATV